MALPRPQRTVQQFRVDAKESGFLQGLEVGDGQDQVAAWALLEKKGLGSLRQLVLNLLAIGMSWKRLRPQSRTALWRLSVFRRFQSEECWCTRPVHHVPENCLTAWSRRLA